MQPYNDRAYNNTQKFQDRIDKSNLLIAATRQAQIQILRAHGGEVTSEFMREQIGGKLAKGMLIQLVGEAPNENIRLVRATPKPPSQRDIRRMKARGEI